MTFQSSIERIPSERDSIFTLVPAKQAAAPYVHHTKPNNTKQGELLLLGLLGGLKSSFGSPIVPICKGKVAQFWGLINHGYYYHGYQFLG